MSASKPNPDQPLVMWTIYDHPFDYPNSWVMRKWFVTAKGAIPDQEVLLANDIDTLRTALPPGMVRLCRNKNDDPAIVESWV